MFYFYLYIVLAALACILIIIIISACICVNRKRKSDRLTFFKNDEEVVSEYNVEYDEDSVNVENEELVPLHSNLGHFKKTNVQKKLKRPKKKIASSTNIYWANLQLSDDNQELETTETYTDIGVSYHLKTRKLHVHIKKVHNVVYTGKSSACRFFITCIPPIGVPVYKTKKRQGANPIFNEKFIFDISTDYIKLVAIKLSFYLFKGSKPITFAFESGLFLDGLVYDEFTVRKVFLEKTPDMELQQFKEYEEKYGNDDKEDDAISLKSTSKKMAAEIFVALVYDKELEILTVDIRMINDLPKGKEGKPNTYVRLVLTNSSNQELAKKRTGTKTFDVNPIFDEVFHFEIPYSELATVTLALSVYAKKKLKEKLIGWVSFGLSSSGATARKHWDSTVGSLQQVEKWHLLIDPKG